MNHLTPTRLVVVDDHPIVREGLVEMLNRQPDLTVVAQAADAPTAVEEIHAQHPDLVLMDLALGGADGLSLIKTIKSLSQDLRILVLSMHDELVYAERVLRAGAHGYVMKHEATERLLSAVREVRGGGIYLSKDMQNRLMNRLVNGQEENFGVEMLTDRELMIFSKMGEGQGTRMIAEHFNISVKTVESHKENMKRKLGVTSSDALFATAVKWLEKNQNRP